MGSKELFATASDVETQIIINLFDDETAGAAFKRQLEATGAVIGDYDAELKSYRATAAQVVIDKIAALNFVLFIEPVQTGTGNHDQSMALIGADYIRPGGSGTRYDADSIPVGIMDSGFMMGTDAATMHQDLNKNGCGKNYTTDTTGVWNDENGHGTHVLGTIAGTGTADSHYRGVATGVGSSTGIRAAKVFNSNGAFLFGTWVTDAMDWMDDETDCSGSSLRPMVINFSGSTNDHSSLTGTDTLSRKLDSKTWTYKQVYVVSAGNEGSGAETILAPGVAKNTLTVGNVLDYSYGTVGDISSSSSRGPTGDGRMKPNVVAPGTVVTSAKAGTTNQYTNMSGTSMAAPHVTGLVATLMEHYSWLQWKPALLRSYIMATSILHDDDTTPSASIYGLGRVSSYISHWARSNTNGWSAYTTSGGVTNSSYVHRDITVPSGTDRLVVVMTWDEDAASAGASKAVSYDLDLYIDRGADCTGTLGRCGEYSSTSSVDNVEYVIIDNPPAGTYRLKAAPYNAPSSGLPVGITATVIQGDPTPAMNLTASSSTSAPLLNNIFTVTTVVSNPSYVASGVHLELTSIGSGLTLQNVQTIRKDGVSMNFGTSTNLTIGNIIESDSRTVTWTFRGTSAGSKTINFRAWSENGGTVNKTVNVTVTAPSPDLIVQSPSVNDTTLTLGQSFIVSATVRNQGTAMSPSTTLRYYRSADATISTADTQIATNTVDALASNGTSAKSTSATAPATAGTYWIGACVDSVSGEASTSNNCSTGVRVTVSADPSDTKTLAPILHLLLDK